MERSRSQGQRYNFRIKIDGMKRYFLLLLLFLPLLAKGADSSLVFVLNIDSEIHAKSARMLDKALQEAKEQNAMAFVMRLNTFGGALDAAEKMRTALLEAPFTTLLAVHWMRLKK